MKERIVFYLGSLLPTVYLVSVFKLGVRARMFENKACEVLKINEFTGVNALP